ncbi:MAG TPA: hypothetical protein VL049_09005, partial [Candidatus Dormibacteraeota bacterium]|nr:hypothetical protein [Candidatus Dormibacteraeota bacterium]
HRRRSVRPQIHGVGALLRRHQGAILKGIHRPRVGADLVIDERIEEKFRVGIVDGEGEKCGEGNLPRMRSAVVFGAGTANRYIA